MSNILSLNAYSYRSIISGASGKLYVPVTPNAVIYSQFDHISGFASSDQNRGVSVSKIQILNSLLNQLISMKNKPKVKLNEENFTEKQMDSLIKNYQNQMKTEMNKAKISGFGLAGNQIMSGQIFSLEA